MAGRRRNGQTSWDNDFKAGFAAGKRAYAKRPGTVSASDGSRHYSRVSNKYGAQWKSGYNAALDVARGATKTKNAVKAARLGLTSSGRDRAMASRYEADQYGRASRSHKANGTKAAKRVTQRLAAFKDGAYVYGKTGKSRTVYYRKRGGKWIDADGIKVSAAKVTTHIASRLDWAAGRLYVAQGKATKNPGGAASRGRKKNSNWAARLSVAQQQRGMVVAPRKNAAFGTVKYVKTPRGWYVTYVGDSTRHGPFPTKKSAKEYQTSPQHGKYGENPRRKNARKYNTHLKVGQCVAYTPMPGVFGKISKVYSKGDLYDVTWEASGQTQPKLPGNKLKTALPAHLRKHFREDGSSIYAPEWKDVTPAGYGPGE